MCYFQFQRNEQQCTKCTTTINVTLDVSLLSDHCTILHIPCYNILSNDDLMIQYGF